MQHGTIRVHYPLSEGQLVLRTDRNWERDLTPVEVDAPAGSDAVGQRFTFEVESERSFLEYKPCLRRGGELTWAGGTNKLAPLAKDGPHDVYPYFTSRSSGDVTQPVDIPSALLDRPHRVRVYLPPGYHENVLKRYPVLYMHDAKNLFFPEEAFLGREWQADETLDRLDAMNVVDQTIVIGVYARDRMHDYVEPGYHTFGRALVEELKPFVDENLRTLTGARHTGTLGSSLGGVLAFHLAWQWPHVFGTAACLSPTFWHRNDLVQRVHEDDATSRRDVRFYVDSGWPNDNFEVTLNMATALLEAGFNMGSGVTHLVFPDAQHGESSWAARLHLPMQLFSGKLWRQS